MQNPIWLFDLDNTLHNADAGIFETINHSMTAYLAQKLQLSLPEASHMREDYWHRYGATLAGLQKHHPEIDVYQFLQHSHPLPTILQQLEPMNGVSETLSRLKGRKAVFSNAPTFYVHALINAMQLSKHFEQQLGTDSFGLCYKPARQAYLTVCQKLNAAPENCIMIDDSAANLHAAKTLGMKTVLFSTKAQQSSDFDFIATNMQTLAKWGETLV